MWNKEHYSQCYELILKLSAIKVAGVQSISLPLYTSIQVCCQNASAHALSLSLAYLAGGEELF